MAKGSGTTRGLKSSSSQSRKAKTAEKTAIKSGGGSASLAAEAEAAVEETKKKAVPKTQDEWAKDEHVDVDSIKTAISHYSSVDRRNNGSAYSLGYNDQVMNLISKVAQSNTGLASEIAKRLVSSPSFKDYGARLSEKQAYVIAKAAYDNRLVSGYKGSQNRGESIFNYDAREAARKEQAAKAAAQEAKRKAYNESYVRSKTQMKVGSKVFDEKGRECTISGIITKSSGYVKVTYPNGETGKKMAFNLKGEDGNFIRKKPNN